MATRFWLTPSTAPYTPATRRGTWTDSSSTTAGLLARQPAGASTSVGMAETSATTTNVLLGRWISPAARKAGTLSGTVAWITGRSQSDSNAAMVVRAHMFVTAGDTDTVRGTLLSNYTGSTPFPTTAAGGGTAGTAITSVNVQAGDRIVVEFGYQAQNTSATSETGILYYGGAGVTDLVTGNTAVASNPGWVEFSGADALFSAPTADIVDKFTSGIGSRFVYWGGTSWDQAANRATIPANDQYPGLMATADTGYEITGSAHFAELVVMPTGGTNTGFSALVLGPTDNGTFVRIRYSLDTASLIFENCVGAADVSTPTILTYDSTAHRWVRFREASGTFFWETSPDAKSWTTRRSAATPQWLKFGNLRTNFEGYADTGSNTTPAEVDNVNTIPTTVVRVWNGTAWAPKTLKVWNGTTWTAKTVKAWSETAWF
ncbi:hypothetical protein [Actinacidiphila sp. ITFR-21]|uniref:hypothetical protein n=1 Tax=Actinacidiphila sp. ITFR-21 TaxID=3075199 RepID=UPI00288BAF73|nr:hypothetical protein [Streptomyces sp. ITFR-21]WNI17623.1 hypothetical protein RLT57_20250 [Streptomyces sp. ITFR-21]WNI17763.1 hypothetical protein RLT57_20965 [Streptomyces sp. ITFR-21]